MEEKLISKKKPFFPIIENLSIYLKKYNRWVYTPISYQDLLRFAGSVAVYDEKDKDTLWVRVYYSDTERRDIDHNLKKVYTLLHSDGNESSLPYLSIEISLLICSKSLDNSLIFKLKYKSESIDKIKTLAISNIIFLNFIFSPHISK